MRRLIGLALVFMLFLGMFAAPSFAGGGMIKVMTRNQYLGADLTPIVVAPPEGFAAAVEEAFIQIAKNYFPLRAQRLAKEIACTQPDLIGLQEVYDFKVNDQNVGPPFVDHLAETLDALAARGQHYVVAAISINLNITLPFDADGDGDTDLVSVVDRDVILARKGIKFNQLSGHFTTGGLCGVPVPNPAFGLIGPEEFESEISLNGCNFTIEAGVPMTPIGPIAIKRGFVGVDATVRGKKYRFVNTHLDVRNPDPNNPSSAIIQSLQAVELVGTLHFLKSFMPPDRKLILLGDFNSWSEDPIGPIIPPYHIITGAGYADIWDTNILRFFDPNGLTCCQDSDLANKSSVLYERVDIIFVLDTSFLPLAFVTGTRPIYPLWFTPNWASDHAGVFSKLIFPSKYRWWNHWKRMKKH